MNQTNDWLRWVEGDWIYWQEPFSEYRIKAFNLDKPNAFEVYNHCDRTKWGHGDTDCGHICFCKSLGKAKKVAVKFQKLNGAKPTLFQERLLEARKEVRVNDRQRVG